MTLRRSNYDALSCDGGLSRLQQAQFVDVVTELGSLVICMKRIVTSIFGLGLIIILLLGWVMFGDNATFQTGLRNYNGLPSTASDIAIYRNRNISGNFVADFKITETGFLAFATEKHWHVQPISDGVSIFEANAFHEGRPNDKREIGDGLYYSERTANGGGVTLAYDRKVSRAYIQTSSR